MPAWSRTDRGTPERRLSGAPALSQVRIRRGTRVARKHPVPHRKAVTRDREPDEHLTTHIPRYARLRRATAHGNTASTTAHRRDWRPGCDPTRPPSRTRAPSPRSRATPCTLRPVPVAVRRTRVGTAAGAPRRTVAPLSLWCDGVDALGSELRLRSPPAFAAHRGPTGRVDGERPDCKQVVVGLVINRDGFPQAHEIFDGGR